ncbi:MAG TPA: hypothetical protein VKB26_11150 [Candidatus Acidoferrales bacterium]|nr:hypothetical protein [Candidatus Acidoferrales bacterium]
MQKLLRGITGTFFWAYERGSWPYDVMVVVIVMFVLITPRSWFRDQPQNGFTNSAGIVLLTRDPITHIETYRLDRALFGKAAVNKSKAELEEKTHQILATSVEDLKGQRFQVRSIEPVRGDNGSVLYYEVEVRH